MTTWVTSEELAQDVEGQTLTTLFLATVEQHRDVVALRWRNDDGSWGEWTYGDYADRVARATTGLRELGVSPGDRIVLMFRNVAEFHVLDLATVFCGATPVSIYNSSSPEQITYLAGHCQAKGAFVENIDFLERFLKVKEEIPKLEWLGILDDPGGLAGPDVVTYDALLDHGPTDLVTAAQLVVPDTLATIIYTSGTTGPPKGVMINHFNVVFTAESLIRTIDKPREQLAGFRLISYLPMAHIAERMTSHYAGISAGYEVTCCPDLTQLAEFLRETGPNLVFGVPRVWEKLYAGVQAALAADPEKKQKFDEGVEAAKPIALARSRGEATDEQNEMWDFLQAVAFGPVRELIGLDQTEYAITGAAPIPSMLIEWFNALGVPLSEVYGLSETTGPMTLTVRRIKPGSVGPAIPGCEVALADDGEIICRGGNVFAGYLDDPARTAEAIDAEGWFHSGDIGQVDDDGYYTVVDRKKELIITAGGKNISPANLEAALKTIPIVAQACAIGDSKPFVAALLVLDPEVAPAWARQHGIEFGTLDDLADHPEVLAEIERGLEESMKPFNRAEQVKRFTILPGEWLPDSEELTPTMKLKRRGVHSKYAAEIDALYG
ncbi:MAG: AMP-dependent synthetase/ligase [Acidimicrobiales bacterium]